MTGKPLSQKQADALRRSKDGKLYVGGRGCKQTINGLLARGYIDKIRPSFQGSADFWGSLTPEGARVAAGLKEEG